MVKLSQATRPRILALDVLRGVAIVLVLLHHAILFRGDLGRLGVIVNPLCEIGWTGVDLFFVLSGYLIGGLLFSEVQRTGSFNASRFLIRRVFKIWPAYFALVGFAVCKAHRHGFSARDLAVEFWPNLLQVQNYKINLAIPHTWSLAVEEHFYLLLALSVTTVVTARPTWLIRYGSSAIVALVLLITAWRTYAGLTRPFSLEFHFTATHVRADSLLAGVLLAHQATFNAERWHRWCQKKWLYLVVGILLVLPAIWIPRRNLWMHTVGYSSIYLGYCLVLIAAIGFGGTTSTVDAREARKPPRLAGGLAWIGVSSYGIYLWHADLARMPVEFRLAPLLQRLMPDPLAWLAGMTAYIGIAVLAGWLLTLAIERPMLWIRDRLFPAQIAKHREHITTESADERIGSINAVGLTIGTPSTTSGPVAN